MSTRLEFGTDGLDTFIANAGDIPDRLRLRRVTTPARAPSSRTSCPAVTATTASPAMPATTCSMAGAGKDDINTWRRQRSRSSPETETIQSAAWRAGDIVFGGAGDDLIAWNDPTGDRVFGDKGTTFSGAATSRPTRSSRAMGTTSSAPSPIRTRDARPDNLFGDKGNDAVIGGNAGDTIDGGEGDDMLAGFGGADIIHLPCRPAGQ